ncbi:MAG: signal peptidase I [Bacillota bacterium]
MHSAEEKNRSVQVPAAPSETVSAGGVELSGERAVAGESGEPSERPKSALRETLETVLVALVIALLIRSFLVQLYVVDGESMFPTLHHGDRLLVNKIGYRLGEPKPGDVVVVEDPANPRRQLIKRVIAVGGETVEVRNHAVFIDGKPLEEDFVHPFSVHFRDVKPVEVPEGYVYVMGDNRGGSLDSRTLGPVQVSKVEGKAFFLFWPVSRMKSHGPLEAPRAYMQ